MVLSASNMSRSLTQKYNVPGLRYISYPAIPYCDPLGFNVDNWKNSAVNSFVENEKGIKAKLHKGNGQKQKTSQTHFGCQLGNFCKPITL